MRNVVTDTEFDVRPLTPLAELFAHSPITVLVAI